MSTQDTTLPPLPRAAVDEHNLQGGRLLYTRDQMQAYARAAIAAQAPQPSPLIAVGEDGEGQENHCPECGAEPGQMCSDEEGTEHGRKVHAVRQAQQAQGVPEAFPAEIWGLLAEVADRKGTEYTSPWEGPDGEPLQDAADAAIAWILSRAAAPQAEPQPDREPTRLETLHAWATSGEPPCNSFDKGYEAAREFVAMQLAGIGTKGGDKP